MGDVPVLIGTTGDLSGERIVVPDGGLSVGRAPDNDVVILTEGTSRYHASFLYDNGSLWLRDSGSRNGVFVNDVRVVGHKALKVGDVVSIQGNRLEVSWADSLASHRPPAQLAPTPGPAPEGEHDDETSEVERPTKKRWFWPFS
ncbi:MAG: pSer/pThr/pTyr-binding forkhead associated (FHA) protein [Myxococcota bacterium]|jgi:pSer/pThr/pTyr-binding forkhead associated (FHA) protein